MNASDTKLVKVLEKTDFPKSVRVRTNKDEVKPAPTEAKRENTFSKSRDIREDRSQRQMKATKSAQTLPHGR